MQDFVHQQYGSHIEPLGIPEKEPEALKRLTFADVSEEQVVKDSV